MNKKNSIAVSVWVCVCVFPASGGSGTVGSSRHMAQTVTRGTEGCLLIHSICTATKITGCQIRMSNLMGFLGGYFLVEIKKMTYSKSIAQLILQFSFIGCHLWYWMGRKCNINATEIKFWCQALFVKSIAWRPDHTHYFVIHVSVDWAFWSKFGSRISLKPRTESIRSVTLKDRLAWAHKLKLRIEPYPLSPHWKNDFQWSAKSLCSQTPTETTEVEKLIF